jgi:hypothetical protein
MKTRILIIIYLLITFFLFARQNLYAYSGEISGKKILLTEIEFNNTQSLNPQNNPTLTPKENISPTITIPETPSSTSSGQVNPVSFTDSINNTIQKMISWLSWFTKNILP